MSLWVLYLLLLRATVTSFSGFGSVPLVREDLVVNRGVLTDEQLNNAIAISQASPGPLGIYLVVVGYFTMGAAGAVAGMAALATPALLAVPILRAVERGRAQEIRGACRGIVIVSCVLMFIAGLRLVPQAASTPAMAVLTLSGMGIVAVTRLPPVAVIVVSAIVGMVRQ